MTICPYCKYVATNHETLKGETNKRVGDVSFCINCGEVSKFTERGLLKVEVRSLDETTRAEVKKIEAAWLKTRHLQKCTEKTGQGGNHNGIL